MTGDEIRKRFLEYFAGRGHEVVESSPLVPRDDPTLLFTNAGMVQFKRLFMGEEKRAYVRAASSQRCVRAGGKHNDLDNVGYTARHHTFFEMLGNFSFGDYFKEEAIAFAWEFLVGEIGLDRGRLWVSVFEDDDEAAAIWEKKIGVAPERIVRMGEKDNFWAMGDTGPCGPCSEIHFDQGPEAGCGREDCSVECDCDRFLEIWNLVFMQFNRGEDGRLEPLPRPSIDTGMGLERIAAVVQGKLSNYDSDIFAPLLARIGEIAGVRYGAGEKSDTAMRVIADHARAAANLVADGVFPSNEGRGYVLRRIMRRAVRYGRELGLDRPFFSRVTAAVVECMAGAFPHLRQEEALIRRVVDNEEERFLATIDHGLEMLREELARLKAAGEEVVPGDFIFTLYDTYGFPVDIVRDIAIEEGMRADEAGFEQAMAGQKERSRRSWKAGGLAGTGRALAAAASRIRTRFVGYDRTLHKSTVAAILSPDGEEELDRARAGDEVLIIAAETPFYAESGGQVGDTGEIRAATGSAAVTDTVTMAGITVHRARVDEGEIQAGAEAVLEVDRDRRQTTAANHTATHLLHAALREVLGEHVRQAGSVVEPGRLRFDFSHFAPMTTEEIRRVEDIVNREIRRNPGVEISLVSHDEAVAAGAMALFGEKYGDEVRMVRVPDFSLELCGGTHVGACGEIGLFRIVSESGVAAGVRRIEAVTGPAALARMRRQEDILAALAETLKTSVDSLPAKVEKLRQRVRELERDIERMAGSRVDPGAILAAAEDVGGVKVAAAKVVADSPKTLRELGDRVREKLDSAGIAVLGAECRGKAALLALVGGGVQERCPAGELVKRVAAIVGGGGGGRADMAQAGGSRPEKLDEAMAAVPGIVREML